jgi:hypothetical protein
MSDPVRIAVAAARAHDLLAEDHQLLLMTPSAVRTLLARTRRRLSELAVIGLPAIARMWEGERDVPASKSGRSGRESRYRLAPARGEPAQTPARQPSG